MTPSPHHRVLVGMSGGVDSSVAAALLLDQGHEVVGLSLNLVTCDRASERSCCTARDREDARRVCEALGIAHATVDRRAAFREAVVDPFVQGYAAGRTPSPCVACNELIKFRALLEEAARLGCDRVATGHYARIERHGAFPRLLRAADRAKDQSYFLCRLTSAELARVIFPLGTLAKEEVRLIARVRDLPVVEKPESQESCFVPERDVAAFVEERVGARLAGSGDFVDRGGRVLGRHRGIHAYTVGQRRGLGFGIGERQYVVRIDAGRNEIVLGTREELARREMQVSGLSWVAAAPSGPRPAVVRIRSTHAGAPARLVPAGDGVVRVLFDEPVFGVAPGQAAAFCDGDEVIGGGWIEA